MVKLFKLKIKILDKEEMEVIHGAAISILEKTGIFLDSDILCKKLSESGCRVDGKQIYFTEEHVREALKKFSSEIIVPGIEENKDFDLREERFLAHTPEGATFVRDLTGIRRLAKLEDGRLFTRLCDALDACDMVLGPIVPQDVDQKIAGLELARVQFDETTKPCHPGGVVLDYGLMELIKMEQAVLKHYGNRDLLDYFIGASLTAISPLRFPARQISDFMSALMVGMPVACGSMATAGGTAPVTAAGIMALSVSEMLAGLTISQLIRPGISVLAFVRASLLELQGGGFSSASPNYSYITAGLTELYKKKYKMLVDSGWAVSDSKIEDAQSTLDKAFTWYLNIIAGADMISGMGGLESGKCMSYAQLVIDNEIIRQIREMLKKQSFDAEHLAVEIIEECFPKGDFIGSIHTIKFGRKERYVPMKGLIDNRRFNVWEERGQKSMVERAREIAIDLTTNKTSKGLEVNLEQKLNKIIERARKRYL